MFQPDRILIENDALEYPLGKELYNKFKSTNKEIIMLKTTRTKGIPGKTKDEKYYSGKKTLVIGVKKSLTFQTCKPSAHYQLPLVTGCMGQCEYCYLNTQLGDKPYTRVYVNLDEILSKTEKYIIERQPEVTVFEGAATSDPIPVEPYTNALKTTIEFFSKQRLGRFRFVTKFPFVDSLLDIKHNNHTTVRFSINTDTVINNYEHTTPNAMTRLEAASKILSAGYPLGFIIAPVFIYENWQLEYENLIIELKKHLENSPLNNITFEVISHRFTTKAKNKILDIFPNTSLPMDENNRTFKYGQFGYGKYVYPKEELNEMKSFFTRIINNQFPDSEIKYII